MSKSAPQTEQQQRILEMKRDHPSANAKDIYGMLNDVSLDLEDVEEVLDTYTLDDQTDMTDIPSGLSESRREVLELIVTDPQMTLEEVVETGSSSKQHIKNTIREYSHFVPEDAAVWDHMNRPEDTESVDEIRAAQRVEILNKIRNVPDGDAKEVADIVDAQPHYVKATAAMYQHLIPDEFLEVNDIPTAEDGADEPPVEVPEDTFDHEPVGDTEDEGEVETMSVEEFEDEMSKMEDDEEAYPEEGVVDNELSEEADEFEEEVEKAAEELTEEMEDDEDEPAGLDALFGDGDVADGTGGEMQSIFFDDDGKLKDPSENKRERILQDLEDMVAGGYITEQELAEQLGLELVDDAVPEDEHQQTVDDTAKSVRESTIREIANYIDPSVDSAAEFPELDDALEDLKTTVAEEAVADVEPETTAAIDYDRLDILLESKHQHQTSGYEQRQNFADGIEHALSVLEIDADE